MGTDKAELGSKELLFNQLAALNEVSDEEIDINDAREVMRKCRRTSPLSSSSKQPTSQGVGTPTTLNNSHGIPRTTSPPVSSVNVVKDTPLLQQQRSIPQSKAITHPASRPPITAETPAAMTMRHEERRTASTPSIGTSLVLNYSTGIESMLGKIPLKRKKSKEVSIKLVPENERIFKGMTFYYVPPNDVAPLRRFRINKAREFGAIWAGKDWEPSITHIIVDKALTQRDVMVFLHFETLPLNVIMVNEDYPIDCTQHRFLLNPVQSRYAVSAQQEIETEIRPVMSGHPLELKSANPKTEIRDYNVHKETQPRSQQPKQTNHSKEIPKQLSVATVQPAWLSHDGGNNESIVKSLAESHHSENELRTVSESAWLGDTLEELIDLARHMEHLPLNDEEDDVEDDRPPSRDSLEDSDSDDGARRPPSRGALRVKRKGTYAGPFNQENFSCMTGGTGVTPESNPNGRTIEVLQEMTDYYIRTKDHWRQTAYQKAISTLKKQSYKISTYEEAIVLPTIGHRLALKIEEIVLTNHLRKLENTKLEGNDYVLQMFIKIYGVGISQGWKWVQQGHKTLEDLKKHVHLTDNQLLGIEHYNDFLTRIPREEVTALGDIVKATAAKLDPEVQVIIGGSYRRGAASSGDMDCLLTKAGTSSSRELLQFLSELVNLLKASKFLVAVLTVPSTTGSLWHGCCVLPGLANPIWRRIDILLVPETEFGAALIYFTGDDIFNRSMRLLASKKGWRLNQRGLFRNVLRGPGRVMLSEGILIEGADEKRIFTALDVPWRPPEERICN